MQRIHFDSGDLLRVSLRATAGAAVETALARHQLTVGGGTCSAVWRRQAAAGLPKRAYTSPAGSPPGDPEIPTGTGLSGDGMLPEVWRRAVAPYWDRLLGHLEAECDARGRVAMTGGVQQLLATLHPRITWQNPVLRVPGGPDEDVHLDGRGLVLCPSVFLSHRPGMVIRPHPDDDPRDARALLVFGVSLDARVAERIWRAPRRSQPASLNALVGRTRAAALRVLRVGCTTSQLADRLGISAAGASQHASVLREAGLITTHRFRNTVLHTVTPLGIALLDGHDSGSHPRTGATSRLAAVPSLSAIRPEAAGAARLTTPGPPRRRGPALG
ncbi:winged helix-turn-helix domain-containing protein [Streptomyces sp. MZ04]|uniref:ArsR/SmtB family transcription factor n=1 Tax=Streptomyces sp. MZ04 TaxID=2559236 RepID=UPI00107E7DB7|nr:winged helix-turn-helix domain-containing protein [Streptomyces sp. MZ04]TGB07681.1 ArsR family transcriptional regulator [Streptomyces sp. MZ04]